jgi:hypothetical protein
MWSEFYYDETSPSCLRWAIEIRTGFKNSKIHIAVGDVAGSKSRNKFRVKLNGITHSVHKVIYEMFNGPVPDGHLVDHEDGDWCNNKRANLRAIPFPMNNRNARMNSRNTSGVAGVCYHPKSASWQASVKTLDGRRRYKSYSVGTYGEEAFTLVCKWREDQINQLNTAGVAYTERHGK